MANSDIFIIIVEIFSAILRRQRIQNVLRQLPKEAAGKRSSVDDRDRCL